MPRKSSNRLTNVQKLMFGLAAIFLCATILRTIQFEPFLHAQEAVQTFLSGSHAIEQAVQAIGSWTEPENLQAVFSDWFPSTSPEASEPVSESPAPLETLAATAAGVFPSIADPAVYPLDISCRIPITAAVVTSHFGNRTHPINAETHFHKGVDLAAEKGSSIYSLSDGIVKTAAKNDSYGNYLIISHFDGACALYAHCDTLLVQTGECIKGGQKIATVGESGNATGAHLHLELWRAGKLLNPEDYLLL